MTVPKVNKSSLNEKTKRWKSIIKKVAKKREANKKNT